MRYDFFKTSKNSNIVESNGPSREDQLCAIYEGKYWTVINNEPLTKWEKTFKNDKKLLYGVNAVKSAIQTYGPQSNKIPNMRINTCPKTKGEIFHAHVRGSENTYVFEWEIINEKEKIVSLVGFASHENYPFKKKLFSDKDKKAILDDPNTVKLIKSIQKKLSEAKEKVERTNKVYGARM